MTDKIAIVAETESLLNVVSGLDPNKRITVSEIEALLQSQDRNKQVADKIGNSELRDVL